MLDSMTARLIPQRVLVRCLGASVVLLLVCLGGPGSQTPAQAQSLPQLEQQAFQSAAASADPSIVRIETVGGVDLVGDMLTGTGPTTGVVVREDGYIITSRFNFLSKPASVVVTLPDGQRYAAEIVASDLSRMLTLLKIDAENLVPLTPVPKDEFQVGQWALALGRTFELEFPNISVGILSALDRVWGRAIQTDAKTSPINYGGPLIDLTGRCLGIIVPLSPQEQGETAGVEWYDSGIGFAVPLVDILAVLPRLIDRETLKPGLMGIGFEDQGPVSGAAEVIRVRPESPADQAGIIKGDVVIGINGHPVSKLNDLKHRVGPMYAGDVARLTIRRGDETLEKELTLADELKAYQFPYLGIQPDRAADPEDQAGVRIHHVFPETPAAEAGLQTGDRILQVGDQSVTSAEELTQFLRRIEPGEVAELRIQRGGETKTLQATLVAYPNAPPESVERQVIPQINLPGNIKIGRSNEQLPDEGLSFWTYVPENYQPDRPSGLLVWLHPPGDTQEAETLRAWTQVCRERGIILVGPRAGDLSGFSPEQEAQVREVITWMQDHYRIDPTRISVMGGEASANFASRLAFKYRDLIRGLILLSAPLRTPPPDNDPDFPLQLAFVSAKDSQQHRMVVAVVAAMQKRNFPSWLIEVEKESEEAFPRDVVTALGRWLDSLDRI